MIESDHRLNTSYKSVIWAFGLSLFLTLAAYFFVAEHLLSGWGLISVILLFATLQGISQLVLYLHLGAESKPRWNLMIFLFMILIMVVILAGSMWIMRSLDYNLMSVNEYPLHE